MRVGVIGGGLAGLACGVALTDRGHEVTVLEKRPWAGGKTYSSIDPETGEDVDNGQHVFMACTTAYVDFLRRLGTLHLTRRQKRLRVPVIDARGRRSDLWAAPAPAPLHLLPSFAAYRHLSPADKAHIARAVVAIHREDADADALDRMTFAEWLRRRRQLETAVHGFWDLIIVPTLNCRAEQASAASALFVFREAFLRSATSAAIGVPVAGLSRLHVEPAIRLIESGGGALRARCGVERLELDDGSVSGVTLTDGTRATFDAYVSAVPPAQLLSMLPTALHGAPPFDVLARFVWSPIVNVHLWFDGPVADFDFAAFAGTDLQWAFNRTRITGERSLLEHLVVSLSAAERYVGLEKRELLDMLVPQLGRVLPAARARRLVRSLAIKEPDATFVPAPGLRRPGPQTPIANLMLAGAYTDTGWPATMESAVRSGLAAARAVDAMAVRSRAREEPASVLVA